MVETWKISCWLLAFCLYGTLLPAQQYAYVQYHSDTDAPFNQVSTVAQDSAGFLWIGSQNGLYRFDGIRFELFSQQTKSHDVHQLQIRDQQLLFVNDLGIYRLKKTRDQPEVEPILEGSIQELPDQPFYPNDLLVGKDQSLWISQSNHSLGRYRNGNFEVYPFSKSDQAQHLAMATDEQGALWALSPLDGLFYFAPAENEFLQKLPIEGGTALFMHGDQVLIGGDALYIYTYRRGRFRRTKTIPIEGDQVTAIQMDQQGRYLIGTQKGRLYRMANFNRPLRPIYGANEAHRVEALDFGSIHEIVVTTDTLQQQEKLLVCSEHGLWILQQRFFETVQNLPMNNPIGIAFGDRGEVWAPLNNLFEITPKEEGFRARTVLPNIQVNAVAEDQAGYLWVSTTTEKVELRKYADQTLIGRYDFDERGEAIYYLYPDSKNNLWFCQAPLTKPIIGIGQINAQGEVVYYDETKGFSSRVLVIKESSRGEIYAAGIGENSYLYRYNSKTDRFDNLSPPLPFPSKLNFEVHDLTIDDRGVVWLATTDGLLRYDTETVMLVQNEVLDQEEIRGVTHFPNNHIWVATATKGLVYHQQNTSIPLGEASGLPALISSYRCIAADSRGHIWVGTAEGLVYSRINAARLPPSRMPRISKIRIDREEVAIGAVPRLILQPGQELELELTNLSFPAQEVRYQYRLLPEEDRKVMLEDELWQPDPDEHSLKINGLEIGDYVLEIRALQPGGYCWSTPLEWSFKVFLPWYLQSWFLYSTLGLLLAVVIYYFRFFVKRRFDRLQEVLQYSREKLARKEAQLNEKMREFDVQKEALASVESDIHTLELFIKAIPPNASWKNIIIAMGKAVDESEAIDAFEIAFVEESELVHRGYSNQEKDGYTYRVQPFDPKSSLASWAIENQREILINDFEREHKLYIDPKPAYRFLSLLFIPFRLDNGQSVALCAYSVKQQQFNHNDQVMFRVLVRFIYLSVHQQITKEL